ncbi:hypothetical protein M378DRAFT_173420 [Amanita muscaria Koide BX008]|uniref:Protein kinase domain-containing protein n=1 Tax=Amanita muscaria (strain Koide BX008) TaxID=946122 RepID=A0A0C2WGD3_AMAMK|nr:hypothetical protein M378DRAFT_173420 [Amanita muscaria Koide BX008]
MWGNLSHGNIVQCLGMSFQSHTVMVSLSLENEMLSKWRSTNPSVSKIQATIFEVAKAIQYIHSLGIAFGYAFDAVLLHLR